MCVLARSGVYVCVVMVDERRVMWGIPRGVGARELLSLLSLENSATATASASGWRNKCLYMCRSLYRARCHSSRHAWPNVEKWIWQKVCRTHPTFSYRPFGSMFPRKDRSNIEEPRLDAVSVKLVDECDPHRNDTDGSSLVSLLLMLLVTAAGRSGVLFCATMSSKRVRMSGNLGRSAGHGAQHWPIRSRSASILIIFKSGRRPSATIHWWYWQMWYMSSKGSLRVQICHKRIPNLECQFETKCEMLMPWNWRITILHQRYQLTNTRPPVTHTACLLQSHWPCNVASQ